MLVLQQANFLVCEAKMDVGEETRMLTFKDIAPIFLDRENHLQHNVVCMYGTQDTLWEKKYIVSVGDEYIGQFIIWKK